MKQCWLIVFILLISACGNDPTPEVYRNDNGEKVDLEAIYVPDFKRQATPESSRSLAVRQRVEKRLFYEMKAKDLSYGSEVFIRIFTNDRFFVLFGGTVNNNNFQLSLLVQCLLH